MQIEIVQRGGLRQRLLGCAAAGIFAAQAIAPAFADNRDRETASPIKHVIEIIGENRSFDHVFATYKPVHREDSVLNLLSEGIVREDGTPGPNYNKALQYSATQSGVYELAPTKTPYVTLPPALVGGPSTPYGCQFLGVTTGTSCVAAATPAALAALQAAENGLEAADLPKLLTGGTGQTSGTPDARITYDGKTPTTLPPGPYQLTSAAHPYDFYAASPIHRLMQMQQQLDCDASKAKVGESFGCTNDLYTWVETTAGDSNGKAAPTTFAQTITGEGSAAMGFFNVLQGDAPYFKMLADTYAMSDNYHQPVKGGTGANSFFAGAADLPYFTDSNFNAAVPPHNPVNPTAPATPLPGYSSALSEIENPNPQPGTNNYYTQDGYGGGSGSPTVAGNYGGGSYVNCADKTQPGVGPQLAYMSGLPRPVNANCESGHYYLVNNYNPGYFGDGSNAYTDTNPANTVFTIPPNTVPTIGDLLLERSVSWTYYGDGFDAYLADPYTYGAGDEYCNICNWAQYDKAIMTNAQVRTTHLKDTADLYASIANGQLPAVSFVKPSGLVDGHPASSKLELFEAFTKKIVDAVEASPELRDNTVIFITFDEGGGYWDSGYVQPLDFFGDGTRIPLIAVSPYNRGGHISHSYADHVSVLKFIERNWQLGRISHRSRDNLPNPVERQNPYVPVNSPAISDLWDMFDFHRDHDHDHDRDDHRDGFGFRP